VHLQGIHQQYKDPQRWQPERYMPGGEYDQFDESIRPYMVRMPRAGTKPYRGSHANKWEL
jgi:N-acyl-L-homoserine lactone synthetase